MRILTVVLCAISIYITKFLFQIQAFNLPFITLALAVFAGAVYCANKYFGRGLWHDKPAIFGGVVFAPATVLGTSLEIDNTFSYIKTQPVANILQAVALFVPAVFLFHIGFEKFANLSEKGFVFQEAESHKCALLFSNRLRSLLILWAIIFLAFIPCFLAYFPGLFNYDANVVRSYGLGLFPNSTYHPPFYTMIFNAIFNFAAALGFTHTPDGVIFFSLIQMLFMSFIFAFAIWYMGRMKVRVGFRVICLVFFALYPLNHIFAISETKDTPFAGVLLLFVLLLTDLVKDARSFLSSKKKVALLVLLAIVFCLLRNNAVYALILFSVASIVIARKTRFVGMTKIFIGLLCVGSVYLGVFAKVFPAFGFEKGHPREALAIPLQQIANAYVLDGDEMSEDERAAVARVLALDLVKENYNPRHGDGIKFSSLSDPGEDMDSVWRDWDKDGFSRFVKDWLYLGVRHPAAYIDAFLTLNLGSWHTGIRLGESDWYIETFSWWDVERETKAPALLNFYEGIAARADWQYIPFVSLLFDTGTPFWLLFFGLLYAVRTRKRLLLPIFLLPLSFGLTILAGPLTNSRYLYPLMVCAPIYIIAMLISGKQKINEY